MSIILEIHHINVGAGDSTLIIVRDENKMQTAMKKYEIATNKIPVKKHERLSWAIEQNVFLGNTVNKSVLIDGGNGSKQAAKISDYLKSMGISDLDYIVASHYHKDHVAGLTSILKAKTYVKNCTVFDRGDSNLPPKGKDGSYKHFKNAASAVTVGGGRKVAGIKTGSIVNASQIDLGVGDSSQPVILRCIAANGTFLDSTSVTAQISDENDHGLGWVLEYGAFRYFTGGDLGGMYENNYVDTETPLIKALEASDKKLNGHVCALKLNHHGSRFSSNVRFLAGMRPKAAFISSGGYKHDHPHSFVIHDLEEDEWDVAPWKNPPELPPGMDASKSTIVENKLKNFVCTSLFNYTDSIRTEVDKANSKGKIGGDVVLVVDDRNITNQSAYQIFWNGHKPGNLVSDNADHRTPSGKGDEYIACHDISGNFTFL